MESTGAATRAGDTEAVLASRRTAHTAAKRNLDTAKGRYRGQAWRRAAAWGAPAAALDLLAIISQGHARSNGKEIDEQINK